MRYKKTEKEDKTKVIVLPHVTLTGLGGSEKIQRQIDVICGNMNMDGALRTLAILQPSSNFVYVRWDFEIVLCKVIDYLCPSFVFCRGEN